MSMSRGAGATSRSPVVDHAGRVRDSSASVNGRPDARPFGAVVSSPNAERFVEVFGQTAEPHGTAVAGLAGEAEVFPVEEHGERDRLLPTGCAYPPSGGGDER